MPARNLADNYTMPPNPSFIEFPRSDGQQSLWPTSTTRIVDSDGQVNWMNHLDLDSPPAIKWRTQVGKAIAIDMNMPVGPNYVIRDWPSGYRLYDHNKGPQAAPRHDLYLFGSPKGRFRSINEFIPHAIWLMRDGTNNSNCFCKYCSKKTQKEITASMGILASTQGSQSPTPSRSARPRERKPRDGFVKRDSKVYAAVQKMPKPAQVEPSSHISKHAMLVERNADLRAVYSKAGMRLRRWYRVGEVLWCALNPPISDPNSPAVITFWPGVVEEVRLKPTSIPNTSTSPLSDEIDAPTPWTVRQSNLYRMQLLAVSHSYTIPDDQVVPYQAHVPPPPLIEALRNFPSSQLDFSRESTSKFNPCSGEPPNFTDAVAPYAMAVQIASQLSEFWCLTDEWEFQYTVKSPPPQLNPQPPPSTSTAPLSTQPPMQSLQSAIEAAGMANATMSRLPPAYQPDRRAVPEEHIVTQVRFQGLWWGGERIWADDFIRLKVPRRSLAPKGADNIYPPAGPGKAARARWEALGRDTGELGAGNRGVFMRLDGLFLVDARLPDGTTRKECRACGMLYELADLDWEDPEEIGRQQNVASSSGSAQNANGTPDPATSNLVTSFDTMISIGASNPQLSSPPTPYLPPQAPEGYRFRPILPPGHEAIMSLSLISGRYYSRILSHPLLDGAINQAKENPLAAGGLARFNNLWALEGLAAGVFNSVDPTHYKSARTKMMEDAEVAAITHLEAHKRERVLADVELALKDELDDAMGGSENDELAGMEVDELS